MLLASFTVSSYAYADQYDYVEWSVDLIGRLGVYSSNSQGVARVEAYPSSSYNIAMYVRTSIYYTDGSISVAGWSSSTYVAGTNYNYANSTCQRDTSVGYDYSTAESYYHNLTTGAYRYARVLSDA